MMKFLMGTAMGMAAGIGMMMTPAGRGIRRDVHHGICCLRRWMRSM